ncbi:basic proline-rich protein-like [Poecile atricapillus]|uniref:basic proline-rich protein-like n=1 Tax=Poecile atricapillus TaxID=48891 RepID=UPI00273A3250|nr:basic proline-rich protein-like [Poecile atricapillus]
MEDKTQHRGASERAALPLLEGTTAEGRRGKEEKEATSSSTAPDAVRAGQPAEPERSSQRQRRVPPAGQRRSVRRPPPRPAAPAHLSATGSAHLPPSLSLSLSPAAAAGGGPDSPDSASAPHCSSLSRRQLPLSLHPHISPPAAAAAAPKFTALRRHEVILPAPSAGRRTPLPPRRGRRPRRPAARAPRGPGAPAAPERPPLPSEHPCPAAREPARGGAVSRVRWRSGEPSPGTAAGWAAPPRASRALPGVPPGGRGPVPGTVSSPPGRRYRAERREGSSCRTARPGPRESVPRESCVPGSRRLKENAL